VTLAPAAGRAEIEFRPDTGIYSSEELSTSPADFQRTREYRPFYSDDAVGSRLSAGAFGPSGPGGRSSPARYGALPESRAVMLLTDRRLSGRPTSPRQGVVDAVKQTGLQSRADDLERELAEIRRQLAEMRAESTPGVATGLSRVGRIGPDQTAADRDDT